MDEISGFLTVGCGVDIQRTDGRVHKAVVSNINRETRSVTVEWYEKQETKGKEVDLDAIFTLNPHVAPVAKDSKKMVRQSIAVSKVAAIPVRMKPSAARQSLHPSQNGHAELNNNPATTYQTPKPRQTALMPAQGPLIVNSGSNSLSNNNVHAAMAPPPAPGPVAAAAVPPQAPAAVLALKGAADPGLKGGGDQTKEQYRRCSNVVKKVEELKKNREERRARHAEQRAEKQELMNLDPGNPNWEYLAMIRDYRGVHEIRPLRPGDSINCEKQVTVCVRKRPLNKKELNKKEVDSVTVPDKEHIVVHEPKTKVDLTKFLENQLYRFDCTFDDEATNELVYKFTAQPLVQTLLDGGMATCFAYGQTGSGKTHTMGGNFQGKTQDCTKGIYALAANDVFRMLKAPKYRNVDFDVSASFFEIYSGKIFDLLNGKKKLRILEDGKQQTQVVGLEEKIVTSLNDVLKLIQQGNSVRTSGQTSANQHSSRSHAVFQIILRYRQNKKLHGKFSFIDLAGNERGTDTLSTNRQTRMEGSEINKSLLALKECIRALCKRGAHLPFRASKLTQVLRDSFLGDNARICMIATISPGLGSCEYTLNTLRYADRLKEYGAQENNLELKHSPDEDGMMDLDGEMPSGGENDLAQIRSMNEGDMSADMYTLHETVTHLQNLEEDLLETHRQVEEMMPRWTDTYQNLSAMTNEVDYDVDAYVQMLKDLLTEEMEARKILYDKVTYFQQQLAEEEQISKAITPVTRKK